jgi:geranylgeranyl pyrophosphate synthase
MNTTVKDSVRIVSLLEFIHPQMEGMRDRVHDLVAQVDEPLGSMLRRSLDGGKQLRPALVLLVGRMFDARLEPFYDLAVAVHMLHTATLIHDDVVDGASIRRGRETLHMQWPTGATVLAGDYLLGQSTSLVAELEDPRLFKVFAAVLRTMCAGEIRQMVASRRRRCDWEAYTYGIEAKTASLFAASTEMAAILAGADGSQIAALRLFGRELGMAFQVVDDVLDFVGDEAQLGKPAGNDLRQGLITLPTLYYLERVKNNGCVEAVLSGLRDEEHVQAAIDAICASGAIEAALADAQGYARRSQEALAPLPDNASRRLLHTIAEYVMHRSH